MREALRKHVAAAASMDESEFVSECPGDALLVLEDPQSGPRRFATMRLKDFVDEAVAPKPPGPGGLAVLRKSDRNPYSNRLSIGRTSNCDIVFDSETVSKLHAFMSVDDDGWIVTDLGSSNGTIVGETRIAPNQSTRVAFGDRLVFGRVETILTNPALLYARLRDVK